MKKDEIQEIKEVRCGRRKGMYICQTRETETGIVLDITYCLTTRNSVNWGYPIFTEFYLKACEN